MSNERLERAERELASLRKEVNAHGIRLTLAQLWIGLYSRAYDALLHYGVNFKDLREYEEYPDDAEKLPIGQGRTEITHWIKKVENAIKAAVRRKGFKLVD